MIKLLALNVHVASSKKRNNQNLNEISFTGQKAQLLRNFHSVNDVNDFYCTKQINAIVSSILDNDIGKEVPFFGEHFSNKFLKPVYDFLAKNGAEIKTERIGNGECYSAVIVDKNSGSVLHDMPKDEIIGVTKNAAIVHLISKMVNRKLIMKDFGHSLNREKIMDPMASNTKRIMRVMSYIADQVTQIKFKAEDAKTASLIKAYKVLMPEN